MASPKRKTKTTAKTARAHATRSAYRPQAKPAASAAWTQNEQPAEKAQFYSVNFNADSVKEATKQASESASTMMNAMQNMFKPEQIKQFWNTEQFEQAKTMFKPEQMQQQWSKLFSTENTKTQFADFNRESASQFNRSAAQTAELLHVVYDLSRENFSAIVEAGNTATAAAKEVGGELMNYANRSFVQNQELSKQVMSCRTLNDLFDWAGKLIKSNLDSYFTQSVSLSEMLFQTSTDLTEPLNERISQSTDRLSKVLTS
jgi:hypothetical protein